MPHLSGPEVDNQKTMTLSAMSQAMTDTVVKVTFGYGVDHAVDAATR